MKWGAHQVDGRIAANNAVKIRAALRNSIDAKKVFEEYQLTQPNVSDNQAQDRARARSWAMLHIKVDNSALVTALQRLWAEMWVAGDLSAAEAIQQAKEMKKADNIATIDWDTWKPGDLATSLLLQPPKAFKDLLDASGVMIQGLDKTGYERVGTALADSIRLGLSPSRAAKLINESIGDAARALTIAITESSRAMNAGAINRYKEAKLNQMEWMTVLSVAGGSSACEICAPNAGQVVEIGRAFNSGSYQPPAHPHCRCTLLPVIPDYTTGQNGVTDIAPKPEPVVPVYRKFGSNMNDINEFSAYQLGDQKFRDVAIQKKGTPKGFTTSVNDSLREYKSYGYTRINEYLRMGDRVHVTDITKIDIKNIDKAMKVAPGLPEPIITYRAVGQGSTSSQIDELFGLLEPGDVWIDKGYVSTSLEKDFVTAFKPGWLIEIENPKGTKGIMLDGIGAERGFVNKESEWLLPRDSSFEVIDTNPNTKTMRVRVKQ